MKKLIGFIFLFVAAGAVAQTFPVDMDTLLADYAYEYAYGDLPTAEKKLYNLVQATTAYCNMITAVGQGDNASAADALIDLNTILGTSYSLPTFNFSETVTSYVETDSISVGGGEYQDSLSTYGGVLYAIEDNPTTDTSFVSELVSDSLDAAALRWRSDISDSLATIDVAFDSTWETVTADTLKLGVGDYTSISQNGSTGINIISAGVLSHLFSGYNFLSNQANGFTMPNTSTNDVRFIPNRTDGNTGFTWEEADYAAIHAGDSIITSFKEVGARMIMVVRDSTVTTGGVNVLDSLYLTYLLDAENDEQWLGMSATGGIFADSIADAGYGLTDKLPSIFKYLKDTKNGEIAWYYTDADKNLVKDYSETKNLREQLQELQWGVEHSFRYIRYLTIGIIGLCVIVLLLLALVVRLKMKK